MTGLRSLKADTMPSRQILYGPHSYVSHIFLETMVEKVERNR